MEEWDAKDAINAVTPLFKYHNEDHVTWNRNEAHLIIFKRAAAIPYILIFMDISIQLHASYMFRILKKIPLEIWKIFSTNPPFPFFIVHFSKSSKRNQNRSKNNPIASLIFSFYAKNHRSRNFHWIGRYFFSPGVLEIHLFLLGIICNTTSKIDFR